jgi:hypothetical protein
MTSGTSISISPNTKSSAVSADLSALCVKPLSYIAAVCNARSKGSLNRQTMSIGGAESRARRTSQFWILSVKFAEV